MKKILLFYTFRYVLFSSFNAFANHPPRIPLNSALDDPTDMQAKHIAMAAELLIKEIERVFAVLKLRIKIYKTSFVHSKLLHERNMHVLALKNLSKECITSATWDMQKALKKLNQIEKVHNELLTTLENFENLIKTNV